MFLADGACFNRYDHSYVDATLTQYPNRFRGLFLLNPTVTASAIGAQVADYARRGYVGFRLNPYLWPEGSAIDNDVGHAAFQAASEHSLTVGIMAFHGLAPLTTAIDRLCAAYPTVNVVLDHVGFVRPNDDQANMAALTSLAQGHPSISIKISALFRVSRLAHPHDDMKPLLAELVALVGPDRLLFGTDFPFVTQHGGYADSVQLVNKWLVELETQLDQPLRDAIMPGTSRRLFQLP